MSLFGRYIKWYWHVGWMLRNLFGLNRTRQAKRMWNMYWQYRLMDQFFGHHNSGCGCHDHTANDMHCGCDDTGCHNADRCDSYDYGYGGDIMSDDSYDDCSGGMPGGDGWMYGDTGHDDIYYGGNWDDDYDGYDKFD